MSLLERRSTKGRSGGSLQVVCLECHQQRWPQDRGLSVRAAFVNDGSIDCVFMNEVSIWRTYVRLFVTMILNDTSPLSLNRGYRYSILSWSHLVDAAWLMRPGWAEQEPLVQTKAPRGCDPSPAPEEQGHARGRFLVSPNQPSSRGWEFSFGARLFLFLPWMLRTGGAFRHADSSAEEEEVAAPGRSTIKKLLGCGNEAWCSGLGVLKRVLFEIVYFRCAIGFI